jgi:hypothetical protein
MGRRYKWMPYRQFVLNIVKEETHDKHKMGLKCVIKIITNIAMNLILKSQDKNHELYKSS